MMLLVAASAYAEFPYATASLDTSGAVQWYYLKFECDVPGYLYSTTEDTFEVGVNTGYYNTNDRYKWCFMRLSNGRIALLNKAKMKLLYDGFKFTLEAGVRNLNYIEQEDDSDSFYIYYKDQENTILYLDWINNYGLYATDSKLHTLCAIAAESQNYSPASGGIVFSGLDTQEQYCSFTCAYNGNESHTLNLYLNGERVEYFSPYTILRTNEAQEVKVETEVFFTDQIFPLWSYNIYEIPALDNPAPTSIVFSDLEVEDDHCTFSASYTGNEGHQLTLKVNGETVENPCTIARTDVAQQVTAVAEVQFTNGMSPLTATRVYEIPAIDESSRIVPTPSPTTLPIHWYQLKVNDRYVYYDPDGGDYDQVKLTSTASTENNFLWCFVEASSDKILLYNRAARQYLDEGQFFNSDINDSYLAYIVEGSNKQLYLKYYHSGDNRTYSLYADDDCLASTTGRGSLFSAIEIEVEDVTEPTGEIVFSDLEVADDHCTISASYTGNEDHQLTLKVNGETVENPYTIARTEESQQLTLLVEVHFTDPAISSLTATIGVDIPAKKGLPPIVTTPSPAKLPIHWYHLKLNDKYVYYDPNSTNLIKVKITETASTENNFLWCFVQTESGRIMVYNKAANKYLSQGTRLTDDINNSYISVIEMQSDNKFYIKYFDEGNHMYFFLYEESYYLGSGSFNYANKFNAVEVLVEEDLGPVTEMTLTPIVAYTPNNVQTDTAEDYYKLFDKDRSTKWCVDNSTGSWETIWVDFKSDVAFIPLSYTMTTAADTYSWKGRNPKKWKIYAKAKESDSWTTIVEVNDGDVAGLGTENTTDYSFDITGVKSEYQYFRFEVSEVRARGGWQSNHYVFQLAELGLSGKSSNVTIIGDLNGDGNVNTGDVSALYSALLNGVTDTKYDLNGDGNVNTGDVSALYKIILGN